MGNAQFEALAKLLQLRTGPSREAARLVLVEGLPPAAAARQTGISPQGVNQVLRRCERGLELAKAATRPTPSG